MIVPIPAGTDIAYAITRAVTAANDYGENVSFDFNGETVTVSPGDDPRTHLDAWHDRRDVTEAAYRASVEYVRDQTRRAARIRKAQATVNALTRRWEEGDFAGVRGALAFIQALTPPADDAEVRLRSRFLARTLGSLAPAGANVGRLDLQAPGQELEAARWVIGQAVDAFERDYAPHPMIGQFAGELLARWPATEGDR